ncbi:MAG: COG1361 S-layer family protein [Candidatus Heimdallarchaeaceae archaeon]
MIDMKNEIWFVGFIFLLMPSLVHAQTIPPSDSPNLQIQELKYEPYPAEAGKYMDLWIKVENYGLKEAKNVTCILQAEYPFSLDPNEKAERNIGRLPALEEVIFQYKIRIASDAVEGWNEMKLKCSSESKHTWITRKFEVKVKSELPEFAIGKVTSDPLELTPDMDDVKLTVELQNVGKGDAKLVSVELDLPQGFVPSESYSDTANLGTIEKDSSKEANFYIDIDEGVESGRHEANLVVRYKTGFREGYKTKTLTLELNVKATPIFKIEETTVNLPSGTGGMITGYAVKGMDVILKPSILAQGDKAELRIKLMNDGEEEAESTSVRIFKQSDQPFDFEENYDYIGNLKPNQTAEAIFKFTVDDDADLKKYLLDLEIRYIEGNDVKIVEKTIPIEVSKEKQSYTLFCVIAVVIVVVLIAWKYVKGKGKLLNPWTS